MWHILTNLITKIMTEQRISVRKVLQNSLGHVTAFIVGWDDNYSKENFKERTLPENDGDGL